VLETTAPTRSHRPKLVISEPSARAQSKEALEKLTKAIEYSLLLLAVPTASGEA
jgi:hypothetical protein